MSIASISRSDRLFSLDALRGLDMLFLCVVQPLIMAFAWAWDFADETAHPLMAQLNHHWGVFTAYDLIMPLFIFMCGAAVLLALPRRLDARDEQKHQGLHTLPQYPFFVL